MALMRYGFYGIVFYLLTSVFPVYADPVVSDGSDGPFSPSGSLFTLDLPANGIFNFTTINIPAGTMVKFNRNAANTPVYFAATGNVTINGVIDVSAAATNTLLPPVPENPKQSSGPGAFDGGDGATGDPTAVGSDGDGPGAGGGGYSAGGAGNATEGNQATQYSSENGKGDAGAQVEFSQPLIGGSGGGGGSAVNWFGWYSGGYGGGGGGAIQISTPGALTINGKINGIGANGGWGYASALAHGGAGGGGAGGNVELFAQEVILDTNGIIDVSGGYGGGLSTQPYSNDPEAYSSGADGAAGYVVFTADSVTLNGTILGEQIIIDASNGVPTVNEWGMIVLFIFIFGSTIWLMNRRDVLS